MFRLYFINYLSTIFHPFLYSSPFSLKKTHQKKYLCISIIVHRLLDELERQKKTEPLESMKNMEDDYENVSQKLLPNELLLCLESFNIPIPSPPLQHTMLLFLLHDVENRLVH